MVSHLLCKASAVNHSDASHRLELRSNFPPLHASYTLYIGFRHLAEDGGSNIPRNVGATLPHDATEFRNDIEILLAKREKEDYNLNFGTKIDVVI